jgi:tetratricopeptide (TPR) repeat protein
VAIVGRLASMSRQDAERVIHERGGRLVDRAESADWIVVREDSADLARAANGGRVDESVRAVLQRGGVELIREPDFWARLGLVDADLSVARLYTPAMLAELTSVPVAVIRQWHRQGALRAAREVRRLAYFDFEEVRVARKLASLRSAGCSLAAIHRKLGELTRILPGQPRPLADADVVVEGRRLYVRRGTGLAEPSGQLLIDFADSSRQALADGDDAGPMTVSFSAADTLRHTMRQAPDAHPFAADDLRSLAAELEDEGRSDQAMEVYRALLVSGESRAEDHFALAELMYRVGDLPAARERYYMAIELDEDFVEARSNLGCVLAELGDLELAEAAFRGALECHPDYADAHYHLARLLDRLGEGMEAAIHWQRFSELAPASPWAEEARMRISTHSP